jgi:2-keto-4-pentenoate hydratase/2-oxohepta-3-ene-1,7-dioic acid hydratase in catechol pathway
MFHPNEQPMERGWVGRIDGERMIHLAAQTLQAFFLGGGGAREHAEYPLDGVTLLVPVLYPPAVRMFDDEAFSFANPAAVAGPGAQVVPPAAADALELRARVAAVIGAEGRIGGFSAFAELRAPAVSPPKDRDFGSALGPAVVTPDEDGASAPELVVRVDGEERSRARTDGFDWERALGLAAAGTILRPGDLLVSPPVGLVTDLASGSELELEAGGIGVLALAVA